MATNHHRDWPVLKRFDRDHIDRIAMPIGGIGTGSVSLGGRGNLRDFELMNRPAKGFTPDSTFLALRVQTPGSPPIARVLEGPLPLFAYEGQSGAVAPNHGLPRFRECTFEAAFPLGQVLLTDPDVPVTARLQAFSPFTPPDVDRSAYPAAVLRVVLTNSGVVPADITVCFSMRNFVGWDGLGGRQSANVNEPRQAPGLFGVVLQSNGVPPSAPGSGDLAIAVLSEESVSRRTSWAQLSWGDTLLDFWDDLLDDGALEDRASDGADAPIASVAARGVAPAGSERAYTFLLTWHFPNRLSWTTPPGASAGAEMQWIGNHYAGRFTDAWDVAKRLSADLPVLERDTAAFVRSFVGADLPETVREAALSNLSTLCTQTLFRTPDGRFFGWEGCGDGAGCCHGTCTHVWNYEQATGFLFAPIARSMRETEYSLATRSDGLMAFRVNLPIDHAQEFATAAADGQMGCLVRLYREWRLSGDTGWLRELWPSARRSMEFCWIPGGWDADQDGVMEGCQHNTMDVEYYGPNPQMGGWYLAALRACQEMAHALGDEPFAVRCRDLFERGRHWIDANLFNGEYYEHEVRAPAGADAVAPGLRAGMGAEEVAEPTLQLGAGCLVDQLVGQFAAHLCGLGPLLDPAHTRTTLATIARCNRRKGFWGHFNHMRSYALGDETALLMASYPRGRRPRRPFPYFNEVMTGFEYAVAVQMLYEGMEEEGLQVIADIRARYDGRRRSPFDEAECGHHYARAMASWGAVVALTGFSYDGITAKMRIRAPRPGAHAFWSSGDAWGAVAASPGMPGAWRLSVGGGAIRLASVAISETLFEIGAPVMLRAGEDLVIGGGPSN